MVAVQDHPAAGAGRGPLLLLGHRVSKSVVSVLLVAGQLWVTTLWSGLMPIVYRSRPDIEAADPAASALRYRRFLAAMTRTLLAMAALADTTLLLIALPDWQVYRFSGIGRALPALPVVAGVLLLAAVTVRAGHGNSGRSRPPITSGNLVSP
jgi:uncharacterized membrane protein